MSKNSTAFPEPCRSLEDVYVATPLSSTAKEARFIQLWPGEVEGQPICTLFKAPLNDCVEYHALSYAWGYAKITKPISLTDGDPVNSKGAKITEVEVPTNLEAALRFLRARDHVRVLWADAICINQRDDAERSAQVQIMDEIYRCAERTVVWLGNSAEGEQAMRLIQAVAENDMSEALRPESNVAWAALPVVLQSPWWSRLWVVQELIFSSTEPLFHYGQACLSWHHFEAFNNKYNGFREEAWHYADYQHKGIDYRHGSNQIEKFRYLRQWQADLRTWDRVLIMTSHFKATDPRDNLFALLTLIPETRRVGFIVDYSKLVKEVYQDFIQRIVEGYGCLEMICFHKPRLREDLPSWVPDFSSVEEVRRTNALEVMMPGNANNDISLKVTFLEDGNSLVISGLPFDTVEQVVPSGGGADIIETCTRSDEIAQSLSARSYPSEDAYAPLNRETPVWEVILANRSSPTEQTPQLFEVLLDRRDLPTDFESDLPSGEIVHEDFRRTQYLYPLLESLAFALDSRYFLATENGFMGMGPVNIQAGDLVIVAFGCGTPLALRRDGDHYIFIGPCHIPAIMEGEWVGACRREKNGDLESVEFCLQ